MATAFYMQKIKEENGIYYYEVSDCQSINESRFIIVIDASKKTLYYFLTLECKNPISVINFNETSEVTPVPPFDVGTASSAFILAAVQAYKAIIKNFFPDHIGRYL